MCHGILRLCLDYEDLLGIVGAVAEGRPAEARARAETPVKLFNEYMKRREQLMDGAGTGTASGAFQA